EQGEDEAAEPALAEAAPVVVLDLGARLLDERVVLHAGRAGGHAGHAAQAAVEVADDRRVEARLRVGELLHEVDPAARRVHLLAPRDVGRAGRQAEAAVDAGLDELAVGQVRLRASGYGLRVSGSGPVTGSP